MAWNGVPSVVPVLSRGKHRSPRQGACFMEFASFLAGERWSDHPKCTHPLLAGLARVVNDQMSDEGRARLVGLIPSVVGLTGQDPGVDVGIAVRCGAVALPVAAEHRQRALAAGLQAARQVLQDLDDQSAVSRDSAKLMDLIHRALAAAPAAARWAEELSRGVSLTLRAFQRRSAPTIVRVAVTGIAQACIPDPDSLLHELLATVIGDCTHWFGLSSPASQPLPRSLDLRISVT